MCGVKRCGGRDESNWINTSRTCTHSKGSICSSLPMKGVVPQTKCQRTGCEKRERREKRGTNGLKELKVWLVLPLQLANGRPTTLDNTGPQGNELLHLVIRNNLAVYVRSTLPQNTRSQCTCTIPCVNINTHTYLLFFLVLLHLHPSSLTLPSSTQIHIQTCVSPLLSPSSVLPPLP